MLTAEEVHEGLIRALVDVNLWSDRRFCLQAPGNPNVRKPKDGVSSAEVALEGYETEAPEVEERGGVTLGVSLEQYFASGVP